MNPNEVAIATLKEVIKARETLDYLTEVIEHGVEHYAGECLRQHQHSHPVTHPNPGPKEPEES